MTQCLPVSSCLLIFALGMCASAIGAPAEQDGTVAVVPDSVFDNAPMPTSAQMVDALNGVFGKYPRKRANHANGMLLSAVFTPTPQAAAVSRAPHFNVPSTPVLVRFSNFGGIPDIGDGDPGAAPYGMSLKFSLPQDGETDLVMHSFNGFPSATTADFIDFLTAMGKSPPHAARPTMLERYADTHPRAKAFLAAPKPAPASFGTQAYYGVNTFKFSNASGAVTYGRYRMVPTTAPRYLDQHASATAAADYLRTEIRQRVAAAPLLMRLQLQIAAPGDALEDPSITWPDSRRVIDLGTLAITAVLEQAEARERTVAFMPDELPDGIEPGDPMIQSRTRAYAESLERRLQ